MVSDSQGKIKVEGLTGSLCSAVGVYRLERKRDCYALQFLYSIFIVKTCLKGSKSWKEFLPVELRNTTLIRASYKLIGKKKKAYDQVPSDTTARAFIDQFLN